MERAGGERGPARLPSVVLATLVLVALGFGVWWWTDNAPDPVPAPSGGGGLPLPGRLPLPDQPPAPEPVPPVADGLPALADLLDGEELAAALLPRHDEAVLGHGTALSPGDGLVYDGAAPTSEDYLLEMACRGGGVVTVEITLPNLGPESQEFTCDGAVRDLVLSYRFGHAAIRVWTAPDADAVLFAFHVRPR